MALASVQIAFRSNPSRYSFAGAARLINAYAEAQGDDGKAPMAVLPCPGMVSCVTVTDTPNRGLIFLDDLDCGYSVHSSGVYKFTLVTLSPFVLSATRIGTLPGSDQVQMSRNQADPVQISIHCAAGEFYIEADVVKRVPADTFTTEPVTTEYVGGYTVYGEASGRFDFSSINVCQTVDPLDFATAEQYADKLVRIKADGPDMFIFSRTSVEPWRLTGDSDLPFQLVGGSVSKKGLVAANSVVTCDNTLMFAGADNIAYRFQGYSPQRITTHAIERYFESDEDRENITALSYTFEGHSFAAWTGDAYTVSFDAATNYWHNRESYANGGKWRARNAIIAWGKTVVGDALSGNLYYLDKDAYDEGGDPMIWGIDTPFLHAVGGTGGIVDALHFDVATGVGTYEDEALMMLEWSVDGGRTFKGNRELKLGKRGEIKKVRTRRIGRFGDKGIMFRIRVSDAVIRGITEIAASVRPLST
ncbi:hypothetical protein QIH93_15055 [Bradyrhizobium ottawaense]|jgi:hypothetical protein|uniref:hypothetical protein n=1 Tax=Bradyrhizobium ottawaense TaxID=931866 RepID=UPI002714E442|nr:hypothetical protein [Bradyrhizobium ottawaense]WLB49231.1 hypothetical protein QIH93_15055 [Bradyrhizobium ottawaense]